MTRGIGRFGKMALAGIGGALALTPMAASAQVACYSGGFTFAYSYCNVQACSEENRHTIYVSQVLRFEPGVRIDPLREALDAEVKKRPGGKDFFTHFSPCFYSAETAVSQGYEARRGVNKDLNLVPINVPGF